MLSVSRIGADQVYVNGAAPETTIVIAPLQEPKQVGLSTIVSVTTGPPIFDTVMDAINSQRFAS